MTLFALIGIGLEIAGFFAMTKSTKKLVFRQGGFISDRHVDPKTGKAPPEIEGPPNPLIYRPGLYAVMVGLGLQIVDIYLNDVLKIEI